MNDDLISERYTNGELAKEISHLIILNAHENMTVKDVEELKMDIHQLMESAYYAAAEKQADANQD